MVIKAVAAAVAAVAMTVGTVATIKNQNKMVKAQKESQKFERQKQELVSMRQRLQAIREARLSLAGSRQAAENQGVADSSSAQGGQGSIISQLNSNLSFLDKYNYLSDQSGKALERAMGYQGQANMWSSIANFGAQVYGMAGGHQSISAAFTGPPPPQNPAAMGAGAPAARTSTSSNMAVGGTSIDDFWTPFR